jgi:hypothetical protein
MSRFKRIGDTIQCTFHGAEYELLTSLHGELTGIVTDANSDDRRFRRLFPPTVLDANTATPQPLDQQALAWRDHALSAAEAWLHTATQHRGIYRLTVDIDDIDSVLQLINDMRLMLGASIDIDAFDRDALPDTDERQYALAIIDHLAWWQEEILTLLTDDDMPEAER